MLEDGVPQEIETFERVDIPGRTPVEQRRDPNNVADMRAQAERFGTEIIQGNVSNIELNRCPIKI